MNYNLKEKVILVTGGSRGIGLSLASALVEEGAQVIICGRKDEGLIEAVNCLGSPENLTARRAHIAREDEVKELFAFIKEKFGRLDGLVNNVGMNIPTPSLADTEYATWQKIIDSNLSGTFLVSREAAAMMKEQKAGRIVSLTSIAGHRASPAMGVYGIAKAGIEMMTRVLASELAFFDIQVNSVAPAMVRTGFSQPFWSNEEFHKEIIKTIPLGRIAEIDDVVQPTLFLLSDGARFITGETIFVDGGSMIR